MSPGVGMVAGGARLAVALHDCVAEGGDDWTISAPLGNTTKGFAGVVLMVDVVPHAPSRTAATATARTRHDSPARPAWRAHRYSAMRGCRPSNTSATTRTVPTASAQISPSRSDDAFDVPLSNVD